MSLPGDLGAIVAADFSDPTNERLIYLSAAGLVVVGLGLLFGTLVWWRRGRQEHPALAPLEVMSGRAWAKAPEGDRRRRLEQVRLTGAAGSVGERARSEPVDLEALVRNVPQAFDDLKEPSAEVSAPHAVVVPVVVEAEEVVAEPVVETDDVVGEPVVESEEAVVEPAVQTEPAADATSISIERPVVPPEPLTMDSKEPAK